MFRCRVFVATLYCGLAWLLRLCWFVVLVLWFSCCNVVLVCCCVVVFKVLSCRCVVLLSFRFFVA